MDTQLADLLRESNVTLPSSGSWLPAIRETREYLGVRREGVLKIVPLREPTDFASAMALVKTRGKLGTPFVLDANGGINNPDAYKKIPVKK
jgi:hypothetical protein